jgi:hypothetical protein
LCFKRDWRLRGKNIKNNLVRQTSETYLNFLPVLKL